MVLLYTCHGAFSHKSGPVTGHTHTHLSQVTHTHTPVTGPAALVVAFWQSHTHLTDSYTVPMLGVMVSMYTTPIMVSMYISHAHICLSPASGSWQSRLWPVGTLGDTGSPRMCRAPLTLSLCKCHLQSQDELASGFWQSRLRSVTTFKFRRDGVSACMCRAAFSKCQLRVQPHVTCCISVSASYESSRTGKWLLAFSAMS